MRKLGLLLAAVLALGAGSPAPPTLKMPGQTDRSLAPESLLGRGERDVRLEDVSGNVTVYHGMPLLEVLEKNGLDLKTMAGERKSAASVAIATARDGYTVARNPNTFDFAAVHGIEVRGDGTLHGGADPGHDGLALAV